MSTITCWFWVDMVTTSWWVLPALAPPPVKSNCRSFCNSTAIRAAGLPLGARIGTMAIEPSRVRSPGPPASVFSPYSGSKQPDNSVANANGIARRARRQTVERGSSHHIHDPLRDDDDLFRALAIERLLYRVQGQHGSLNLRGLGVPGHGDVGALLTVNLHR